MLKEWFVLQIITFAIFNITALKDQSENDKFLFG